MKQSSALLQRPRAVAAVVLVSAIVYGVVGALIGIGALARASHPIRLEVALAAVFFSGALGGGFGAIAGPLVAFSFLRHVPLGRAIIKPAAGAGLTTALTFLATPDLRVVFGLSLAVAILVGIHLRRRTTSPVETRIGRSSVTVPARPPANMRCS